MTSRSGDQTQVQEVSRASIILLEVPLYYGSSIYYSHIPLNLFGHPSTSSPLKIIFYFCLKIGLDNFNLGKRNLKNTIFADTSNSLFNRGYDRGNDFEFNLSVI